MSNILMFPVKKQLAQYVRSYNHSNGIFKIINEDKESDYIKILSVSSNMSILLPRKKIQNIASQKELEASLDSFPGIEISLQHSKMPWMEQYRLIHSKISNNNFEDLLFILKLLDSNKKPFSFGAKKTYSHTLSILTTEYAISSGLSHDQALAVIKMKLNLLYGI